MLFTVFICMYVVLFFATTSLVNKDLYIKRSSRFACSPVAVSGYCYHNSSCLERFDSGSSSISSTSVATLNSARVAVTAATCNVIDCCCWRWCYWWWWWWWCSAAAAVDAFLLWRWRAKRLLQLAHHVSGILDCISRVLSFLFFSFKRHRRTSTTLCHCGLSANILVTNALEANRKMHKHEGSPTFPQNLVNSGR